MKKVADFYNQYPYPNPDLLELTGRSIYNTTTPTVGVGKSGKILIVGCGTIEAVYTAIANPKAEVTGIDIAEKSIAIAHDWANKTNVTNLQLYVEDFYSYCSHNEFDETYDYVVMNGVLHHMEDRPLALKLAHDILKEGGVFGGMVYNKEVREKHDIRKLNTFFLENQFSINDVRKYFEKNPNKWYKEFYDTDTEVADTWLNPHFYEYSEEEFRNEVKQLFDHCDVWGDGKYTDGPIWVLFSCKKGRS